MKASSREPKCSCVKGWARGTGIRRLSSTANTCRVQLSAFHMPTPHPRGLISHSTSLPTPAQPPPTLHATPLPRSPPYPHMTHSPNLGTPFDRPRHASAHRPRRLLPHTRENPYRVLWFKLKRAVARRAQLGVVHRRDHMHDEWLDTRAG